MSIRRAIIFLIIVVIAFSCFLLARGACDPALLRLVNKRIPFTLKWEKRSFLNFHKIELTKDNVYFYAPLLKVSLRPYIVFQKAYPGILKLRVLIDLKFEDGYASSGKEIIARDIRGTVPLEFIWPDKFYSGNVSLNCSEIQANKIRFFKPGVEAIINHRVILIQHLYGEILGSPAEVRGKIDMGKKCFTLSGQFDRIDLEMVSATINLKKFGGRGKWRGDFGMSYGGDKRIEGEGKFSLLSPGGELKTVFLKDLIQKMPEGEAKNKLLQGLGEGEYFPISDGNMDFYMKDEALRIKLLIKGEKGLFDFTINLPVTLAERFLSRTFLKLKGGGRHD